MIRRGPLCCVPWLLTACSLSVSELDDYRREGDALLVDRAGGADAGSDAAAGDAGAAGVDATCGGGTSLCVELSGLKAHVDEMVVVTLGAADTVRARAIFDPMSADDGSAVEQRQDLRFVLPAALAGTDVPQRLQIFTDHDSNHDRTYTPPPDDPTAPHPDHAWVVDVPSDGVVRFQHNAEFANLRADPLRPIGGDFRITLLRMGEFHSGEALHLWVYHLGTSERVVGYYRLPEIPAAPCDAAVSPLCAEGQDDALVLVIPGILDERERYEVQILADRTADGRFEPNSEDHSWRFFFEANAVGYDGSFEHNAEFEDLDPVPEF
ncbi:MAG: hypothetical protein OEZ06_16500 [Myxococcales bacterium]|nr:hypothetical protein [Myxococcales bacterium]